MVVVPEFLIKRVYKKGSLRKTEQGICFELKNILGPGVISGFNFIEINGVMFTPENVRFSTQGVEQAATDVCEANPVNFRLGQEGTLICVGGDCLQQGVNKIVLEVSNPEAGTVKVHLEDVIG